MDPVDIFPTQSELAFWRGRGATLADENGQPVIAEAFRSGGAEAAVRSIAQFDLARKQWAFRLFLSPISPDQTLPDLLAMVANLGQPDNPVNLPPIVAGFETTDFAIRLDELRDNIRAAGASAGRRRQVRFVEYVGSTCAAVRLSELGAGKIAFQPETAHLLKNVAMSLILLPTLEVVKDIVGHQQDLSEAFALALGGWSPISRSTRGWTAKKVLL